VSLRYFETQPSVRSTTHRCRPNFSLLSLCPFLLYGSLSRAFARLPCTSYHRRLWVGVQLLGTPPRSSSRTLDGLYSVDEFFEDHPVVDVCGREHYRQWDAPSVRNKVALRALLSFIRGIRSGFWAPLLAGMEAESSEARSHSIWSASPRRSRRIRCSLSHTPASCHSFKRRQQLMPDPQPISFGSISQGMPLFSTKTMPVRAARLSMRGLPPWGFGGSGGRSGWMVSHSSSVTSS
jgi:hypothetical protein